MVAGYFKVYVAVPYVTTFHVVANIIQSSFQY